MHTNTVVVQLQHSTGRWIKGLLDCDTVHSRFPTVLFDGADNWTELHEDRIREMDQGAPKASLVAQNYADHTARYIASHTHLGPEHPQRAEISVRCADLATAQDLAGRFPKSVRAWASPVINTGGPNYALVHVDATLLKNGANGGKNETGIKRLRAAEKVLDREGITVIFGDLDPNWINIYRDRADFDAVLNA